MAGIGRRAALVVLTGPAVIVAWALGVVAFFLVACVVAVVPVLYAVAVLVCLGAAYGLVRVAARAGRLSRRRRYSVVVAGIATVALVLIAMGTVLRPLPGTPGAHRAPPGTRHWSLPNGDRLAYLRLPAPGRPAATPVILVGGGPGEADVTDASQTRLAAALARYGHDVYVYDQLGAGLSTRLADPSGYTVTRHVADLDAVRDRLGAERLILLGASWGGSLAASYLARHPGRVERVIFTSPAPMDYAQWPDQGAPADRLPPGERRRADAVIPGDPRFLFRYALARAGPRAAHALAPDREMDAYFSAYLRLIRPATVCDPGRLTGTGEPGNGLYDNIFSVADARRAQSEVPGLLSRLRTPALIVTGGCDYLRPGIARQYRTTLANSTQVCLPDAGHAVHIDRPGPYARLVGAFLRGSRPPDAPCH